MLLWPVAHTKSKTRVKTDLEIHAELIENQHLILEERFLQLENNIDEVIESAKRHKRVIITTFSTLITGTIGSLGMIIIKIYS